MAHRDPSPLNRPDGAGRVNRPDDEEFSLVELPEDEEEEAGGAPPAVAEDPEEDVDYELEAPDEKIEEGRRRRAVADLVEAEERIDIDEIYRDLAGEERDDDLDFRFQFQIKHMLIATAAVAILLSLAQFTSGHTAVFVVFLFALAGAHAYLSWRDRKRQAEADARRHAMYQRQRRRAAGELAPAERAALEVDEEFADAIEAHRVRVSFSTKDLLVATTVAAVVMGLGVLISFPALAAVLGFLAVAGLVVYGLGYDPPPVVVTVWWMTLVLYIVLCTLHAAGAFGGA